MLTNWKMLPTDKLFCGLFVAVAVAAITVVSLLPGGGYLLLFILAGAALLLVVGALITIVLNDPRRD